MKKILSILLIVTMLLASLVACSSSTENEPQNNALNDTSNTTSANTESNTNNTTPAGTESNTNNTPPTNTENVETNNNQTIQNTEEKYNSACSLISQNKYAEAYNILKSINSYAPAQEKLKNFFYAPKKISEERVYTDEREPRSKVTEYIYDETGNVIENSEDKIWTYDENGNVLSGCDLIYGSNYYTYTYKDGKLYQQKESDESSIKTYTYNSDGTVALIKTEYSQEGRETSVNTFEYTYYSNSKIKTMSTKGSLYSYDEDGRTTRIDWIYPDTNEIGTTFKATYGEFGITKIVAEEKGRVVNYTYSYEDGKLASLLVKQYENGKLYSTRTLEYTKHQLYYSENPSVQARLAQITCTDIEAASDLVW